MKNNYLLIILLAATFLFSCKKKNTYYVEGFVVNKNTQEPLEGVKIKLEDGIGVGGILPNEVDHKAETFTEDDGSFEIEITTESNHAVLWLSKEGYEYKLEGSTSDTRHYGINNEYTKVKLEMEGIAYFNSPFYKTSDPQWDNDSLIITLLSYDDLEEKYYWYQSEFRGKGAFLITYEDSDVLSKGDRYLRYKLEFTSNGEWQTKIDSVYLTTSLEVYRDTIYY